MPQNIYAALNTLLFNLQAVDVSCALKDSRHIGRSTGTQNHPQLWPSSLA